MNKEQILTKIKKYLSDKFDCDITDLDKKELNILKNKQESKLKMLLFYDLILVSSSENIYTYVCDKLKDKNTYEVFEFPLVYGQSIYFIPNLNKISKQDEISKYEFKIFDGNTDRIDLSNGFENAITFENGKCISDIAYCAYKDGKIIGVAGADKINDDIWKVGIEVLPVYRKEGVATILTKNLTLKILEKWIVPIWCASVSNIGSQAVATNSDYIPLWMETFGDVFEKKYVFKDIIRKDIDVKNRKEVGDKMTKVLKFKVGIEGLEDKIYREIEITDRRTVADLAYTILATFNSLAYHLYDIEYKGTVYDCWVCIEDNYSVVPPTNATITKLGSLDLKENDKMTMDYDTGSTTTFHITYLGSRDFEKGNGMHYPYITNGSGAGMLDDLSDFELQEIVKDTDKKGKSEHHYTPGYETKRLYDYREFNLDKNNLHVKRFFSIIKKGYEEEE